MFCRDDLLIDAADDQPVCINRPQFFHQVKCQTFAAGARAVHKANIRVQAHSGQGGCTLPRQHAVGKRKQRIHIVQRWTAAAALKHKILLLLQNQVIQAVKVALGCLAFQAAQLFRIIAGLYQRQRGGQLGGGAFQFFDRDTLGMIAGCAFQHPACVIHFTKDKAPGIATALGRVIRHAVLRLTQQHIAAFFPHGAGLKSAIRVKKAKVNAPPGTSSHQSGAGTRVSKADDAFQRMQGIAVGFLLIAGNNKVFAIQCQVSVLIDDKQGVEQLSHGAPSSICSRRYAAGSAC